MKKQSEPIGKKLQTIGNNKIETKNFQFLLN